MRTLLLLGLLAATARAVDVSGIYENAGSMVNPASPAAAAVSLQGLLGLEFNQSPTLTSHSQVDRVVVQQTDGTFLIECKDADGAVTWSSHWKRDLGYGVEADQVNLIFRAPRFGQDGFLFSLRPIGDRKLLLVEVRRINATYFGPVAKPMGTYLFARLPER